MTSPAFSRHIRNQVLAAVAMTFGAALLLGGCSTDTSSERISTQRSAIETPPAGDGSPTFKTAAKEQIDWKEVLSQLGKDNIFRILYKGRTNGKGRGDDGMSSLTPDEQKSLAQYTADMKEVYALHVLQGEKGLGDKERTRVAELQKKYAADRQELYKILMNRPELSAEGRAALHTALNQINGTRGMILDTSSL